MSIIGETILSVSIEMLFKTLSSKGLQLFTRREQIHADLKRWEPILSKIHAVLDDADERQREQSVKLWLDELQDLAYDVEDLLDEFSTEALRRKLLLEPYQPSSSKLKKLIPTCCTNFNPRTFKFDSMMRRKIDEITVRLQNIATVKDQLELKKNSRGRYKKISKRQETTSLVIEAEVYGREKEKKEIVNLLLNDELRTDGGFSVIPITGMGGLGKTTLAQLVYNDETVKSHFDLRGWACVSEDFDAVRVTKAILKSIGGQNANDDDLNSLQVTLKDALSTKKFLLVLDDMWNENYGDWTNLRLPFVSGAIGSRIIVTTRNQGVASMMGTASAYELKKLLDDDCLVVFTQHSLGTRDFSKHRHLKEIGEKIVKKCNGLPLAAKTLGGLLRNTYDSRDWEKVLNNKIWDLPEEGGDIMRALRISYYYLPASLKRCFAYCSLLPKDYEFDETEIVLLWMAEGFLQPDVIEKEMEELGHDYFEELHSRSFFLQSSMDKSRFVMHDLINDLAQWAGGEIYYRMEDTSEGNKQKSFSKNLRHSSSISGRYDNAKKFEAISDVQRLRTFLPINLTPGGNYLSRSVVYMLLRLQYLRVLSLRGYYISQMPNSIGDLKYLRHLDLSGTEIVTLPESTNTLYNLHTLLLEDCKRLRKLCPSIENLIKLRHLKYSFPLEEMPLGIGKLTCLQTLCFFAVGENTGSRLRELKSLNNLQGELMISRLENVKDVNDANEAVLNGKRNLNVLFLKWSTNTCENSLEPNTEALVLDILRPHENLKELTISGYHGTQFPIWLEDSPFSNLVLMRFEYCGMCTFLPLLGQLPILKHLFISHIDKVKSVGSEFYGNSGSVSFSSLETLYFEGMEEWEEWIPHRSGQEVEVFSQLRELSIVNCSKLQGRLPERLPSLERLVIQDCRELLVVVPCTTTRCKLEIGGCKKVVCRSAIDLSSQKSLVSSHLSNEVFLTGLFKQELPNLEKLEINTKLHEEIKYLWQTEAGFLQDISSLRQLTISDCVGLLSLVAEEEEDQKQQGLQCRLHYLELRRCPNFVKLPQALLSLSSLKEINIEECGSQECLFEAWMHNANISLESLTIHTCHSLTYIARVRLPPSLKRIEITNCRNLRTLIDEDQVSIMEEDGINSGSSRCTSLLENLVIIECPSLTSLWSKSELPATLKEIGVASCSKLAFLSSRGNLPKGLKMLIIFQCEEMELIAERGLDNNTSLEAIVIMSCKNLRFLPNGLHKLCNLQRLSFSNCPNLITFPEGGLPSTKLTYLSISRCEKLKALPKRLRNLTSLQLLEITDCPNIEFFPEDGFPTNLTSLEIDYQKFFKPLCEWGLHRFNSFRELELYGECSEVESFPPEDTGIALPTSLTKLRIRNFPNLERLSPVVEIVTSLEILLLDNCPKLKYFPENGLPTSLLNLDIRKCPLIEEKCKKDKGEYWHLIANIPCVEIDHRWVYNRSTEEN